MMLSGWTGFVFRSVLAACAVGVAGQAIAQSATPAEDVAETMPSVWIGVRLSPQPEALAAHLQRDGLMVQNVAHGSPADKAGIERYDVIVAVGGEPVREMTQLTGAVAAAGAGNPLTLTVLRKGKEQTLTVTPATRPSDQPPTFKYEEAEDAGAPRSDVRYFGHMLRQDPSGAWTMEPLGRMLDLPDALRDRTVDPSGPAWRGMFDALKLRTDPLRLGVQLDPANPDDPMFFFPDDAGADSDSEIEVRASRDGTDLTIRRDRDGEITVTRKRTSDGSTSEARFDSVDELRERDAEAYREFRRYAGFRGRTLIQVPPDLKNLDGMQREFQEKIEKLLQEARDAAAEARRSSQRARDLTTPAIPHAPAPPGARSQWRSQSLHVDADGRIRISIDENGDRRDYEFESREAFQREMPDLYEQLAPMLPK